jgi:hypothetical protein
VKTARILHEYVATVPGEPYVCRHLLDVFQPGTEDTWATDIGSQGWMIITADRGMSDRNRERSLPFVCLRSKILHFRLSASVAKLPAHEQARGLIALWPSLRKAHHANVGCRWSVKLNNDRTQFRLVDLNDR